MKNGIIFCLTCVVVALVIGFASGTFWAHIGMGCGLVIGIVYGMFGDEYRREIGGGNG